ncbi:N-acetyltransferase family protein [Methyloraptor flagellatus]|jgi:GNAT superfamily N-acetyltransferase|uniref:GNAT family N-acetyltransferase n=1 Tax=Methyloraptor flagellatus TaxID=3162530 RepID=A0AAU7XEX4_9HYPH
MSESRQSTIGALLAARLSARGDRPTVRPAEPADGPFLYASLRAERAGDFVGLPPEIAHNLIDMQIRAQFAGHIARYPALERLIVEVDDAPAGRLSVVREDAAWRIVDFAVSAGLRGQGLGSALLAALIDAADAKRDEPEAIADAGVAPEALRLSVFFANVAARRLYARHGFVDVAPPDGEAVAFVEMVRPLSGPSQPARRSGDPMRAP